MFLILTKGEILNTDIVDVTTADGIPLSGAYFANKTGNAFGVDALIYFHGDGGNFYGKHLMQLGGLSSSNGLAFLAANRRGHDIIANGVRGGALQGYAYESVSDSPADYTAWIEFLLSKGHQNIVIGGHSGGAVRATYAQAQKHFPNVRAVVSVSPGEYNHEKVFSLHRNKFASAYLRAQADILKNRPESLLRPGIPWGSTWTARAFVDCFNADNRYSVSSHAANTGVPTLYIFGGKESEIDGEEELPVCGLAMRTLNELAYKHTVVKVVTGANHGYAGRETQLWETISTFLGSI
jgi:hypothetical protein